MSATRALFYTPLKHPLQSEPSGDREIARTLMRGLAACGFAPELASRLSTWRRGFDAAEAERVERCAALVAARLVHRARRRPPPDRPGLWLTYQNYHRCPDLLGPVVASALDVPYVLVDPAVSRASRRTAFRPWVSAVRQAVRRADLIFAMSPRDVPALAMLRGSRFAAERIRLLPPAVDVERFAADEASRAAHRAALEARLTARDGGLLLCVAMMRAADKLDSYRLLAAALARLEAAWRLVIVGDGPARREVEAAFAPLPRERVTLAGAVEPAALPPFYLGADLLAFPGLGDALGLVYLEAAAAGLPVVACEGPGPAATVAPDGAILTAPTADAFATGLAGLLLAPARRQTMGAAARRFAVAERSQAALERRLGEGLASLVRG